VHPTHWLISTQVAVAIRSSDLAKAYGPLREEICGVNQTAAAAAWRKARRELVPIDLDEYDADVVAERDVCSFRFSDGFPARAVEGEVSLSCAADAVGLVVRYDEGFGFENRCLVRFESGPRLRYALGLDGRCRLDVVS
jgi:hypothetical protein